MEASGTLNLDEMTVAELRAALLPYGTLHRLTMRKQQLKEALLLITQNEKRFGSPGRPHGFFSDEEKGDA